MAEIWGAAIAVGGSLLGGALSSNAAGKAAKAAAKGADAATAEQRRQYDQTREDTSVARNIGNQALGALGGIYGYGSGVPAVGVTSGTTGAPTSTGNAFADTIAGGVSSPKTNPSGVNGVDPSSGIMVGPGGAIKQGVAGGVQPGAGGATALGPAMPAGPDYSNFFASPDYQFRKDQGMQGVERSASAVGLTGSGNALAALADYNSGLAAGEFGNYFNRQATLAGIGNAATNTVTSAGMNSANNIGQNFQNAANARASGIGDAADAWGNALGTIGGIAYDRWGRPKKGN